ncbi:MAG: hypothetical protein HY319_27345 [Armatimonadetes bacterium]|nr:hypothetical protein [Armatimonadota bacterium]
MPAALEDTQRQVLDKTAALEETQRETGAATSDLKRHFETFLVRFDETLGMLVQHDTDQLQRVAALER